MARPPRGTKVQGLREIIEVAQEAITRRLGKSSQRATDSIIRKALMAAGEMWVRVFLPKRFDPGYSGAIGYRTASWYDQLKVEHIGRPLDFHAARGITGGGPSSSAPVIAPQPTPFVLTGESRTAVLSSARVEVRAYGSKGKGRILIHVSPGNIARSSKYASFVSIPTIERQRVADEVRRQLTRMTGETGAGLTYDKSFRWNTPAGRSTTEHQERSTDG